MKPSFAKFISNALTNDVNNKRNKTVGRRSIVAQESREKHFRLRNSCKVGSVTAKSFISASDSLNVSSSSPSSPTNSFNLSLQKSSFSSSSAASHSSYTRCEKQHCRQKKISSNASKVSTRRSDNRAVRYGKKPMGKKQEQVEDDDTVIANNSTNRNTSKTLRKSVSLPPEAFSALQSCNSTTYSIRSHRSETSRKTNGRNNSRKRETKKESVKKVAQNKSLSAFLPNLALNGVPVFFPYVR